MLAGVSAFVLSIITAALLIGFLLAFFSLLNNGAVLGWTPPGDVPLWLVLVVLAIAYAAAISGEGVLLVDASSTDTDLSDRLAADFDHGDLVVLDNPQHLRSITRLDARSGLVFLPIALADLRTLRTHQRKRLAAGISNIAEAYDLVVIDAGSLLEDESATALMAIADQIVLLQRHGDCAAIAQREAMRMIEPFADRFAGVVTNMAGGRS